MELRGKATRITLSDFSTPQMRTFHMSWFALLILGMAVTAISFLKFFIRFTEETQIEAQVAFHEVNIVPNEPFAETEPELAMVIE